eukprot:4838501-Prymnesium_polylepis.1
MRDARMRLEGVGELEQRDAARRAPEQRLLDDGRTRRAAMDAARGEAHDERRTHRLRHLREWVGP